LSVASTNVMDKAAAAFKKEQQAREGEKAMAEYRAAQVAEELKTERLRALRLARDNAGLPPALSGSASETGHSIETPRKPVARKSAARRTTARKRR
jgi:hypothetical protein